MTEKIFRAFASAATTLAVSTGIGVVVGVIWAVAEAAHARVLGWLL